MPKRGPNELGLGRTLRAMKDEAKLSRVDEALVSLAKGLAKAVDGDNRNAALWREYRAAVAALQEAGERGDDTDDDTAGFIVSIQTPRLRSPMGDPS